jgi:ribosomal protein S18 acetylase RimI-like enzyme
MAGIRDASGDDWELLRTIRLFALKDAPLAFASSHDAEAGRDESWWRGQLRSELWLLAFEDGKADQPIGMIAASREPRPPTGEPFISSLWVDPHHRRQGVATMLIRAAADRALSEGGAAVSLWVLDGNEAARDFYRAVGFTDTDDHKPAPGPSNRYERRMYWHVR